MDEGDVLNKITDRVVGAAIDVHKALGPGLLESAYQSCLAWELRRCGVRIEEQKPLGVVYRDIRLDCGYRMDLVVEGKVIVEVKSVERLLPIHKAQLLSYLRLASCKLGLLINFNVMRLANGIVRVVNGFPDSPRSLRTLR
jgi:GxxExxY protein